MTIGGSDYRAAVVAWREIGDAMASKVAGQLEAQALAAGTPLYERQALAAAAGILRNLRAGQR